MELVPVEMCLLAALLTVVQVRSEQRCDEMYFLHPDGTCVACPVCGAGEQLSEDCGFGDGGGGVCVPCGEGRFSPDVGVTPCRRCTKCNLLNRQERATCSPSADTQCGQCLPGFYELRSLSGAVELSCVPCHRHDTVHKECLLFTARRSTADGVAVLGANVKEAGERRATEDEDISIALIAATSSAFLIALLLWAFLLTNAKFKQDPEYSPGPDPQATNTMGQSDSPSETDQDPFRGLSSSNHESEVHPTSIVINVTTNIRPSGQGKESVTQEEQHGSCYTTQEMEQKLQMIWEKAQGDGIESLDYDTVQDLSLLLDSEDNRAALRRLGRSLGVPPLVVPHLRGFQDLFQYLRTSTCTLLPQLAQAAALLPYPEVVARIHRAVVTPAA